MAAVLGLTISCGGDDETSSDRDAGSRPTAGSTSPSTSADREVTPATVSAEFVRALRGASTARVELYVSSFESFSATGDADFSGSSTALNLNLDFRTSDVEDGSYLVEAGHATLKVPEGLELPEQIPVVPGNPWGYLLVTVDPVVAHRLITDFGTDAQVSSSPNDDVESYSVTLAGRPTLETLGHSFEGMQSEAIPEYVYYQVDFDSRHRLVRIGCRFERYGENFVTFDDWGGAAEGRRA